MEAEEVISGKVNHGHNIRRIRLEKGIKQSALADRAEIGQATLSRYEKTRVLPDDILRKFAKALEVPFETLKYMEENAGTVIFENNTVNNSEGGSSAGIIEDNMPNYNFNPIEKVTELYERMLKDKDEKYAALEKEIELLKSNRK